MERKATKDESIGDETIQKLMQANRNFLARIRQLQEAVGTKLQSNLGASFTEGKESPLSHQLTDREKGEVDEELSKDELVSADENLKKLHLKLRQQKKE